MSTFRLQNVFGPSSICAAGVLILLLAGCSGKPGLQKSETKPLDKESIPANIAQIPDAVPKKEPFSRYGNPPSYQVFGKEYITLKDYRGYRERGIASWYGPDFHGKRTSSGEPYDMYGMTAAHCTLPLPTYARVTNLENGRSVILKLNDRGPFHDNRLIDLSYTAAWKLGITQKGTGLVEVEAIDPDQAYPLLASATEAIPKLPAMPPAASITAAAKSAIKTDLSMTAQLGRAPMASSLPELFVQVGAFSRMDNAQLLKGRLENALKTHVVVHDESSSPRMPVYRVQVGPIASVELCDHLTRKINDLGIEKTLIVIR